MSGKIISFSGIPKRTFDTFAKTQVNPLVAPLFDAIRDFCFSLGSNVVEDIRMHRIVFGKTMTFRWFADVEPTDDNTIIIKIQKDRKLPAQTISISTIHNNIIPEHVQSLLKDAYTQIH